MATHKDAGQRTAEAPAGPKPIIAFLIVIGCIVLLSMVFAAIRVFLLRPAAP